MTNFQLSLASFDMSMAFPRRLLEHPFGHPKLPPDPGRRPGHRRPDCPCTVPGGDPFLPMNGDTIGSITFSRSHRLRGGGGRGSQWAKTFEKSAIEGRCGEKKSIEFE